MKKKTKCLVLLLLLVVVSALPVHAAAGSQDIPKEMLTLTTAVEYALDANPEVLKARLQTLQLRNAERSPEPAVEGHHDLAPP